MVDHLFKSIFPNKNRKANAPIVRHQNQSPFQNHHRLIENHYREGGLVSSEPTSENFDTLQTKCEANLIPLTATVHLQTVETDAMLLYPRKARPPHKKNPRFSQLRQIEEIRRILG